MKINKISWQNWKGLSDGAIDANGADVIIRGQNGSGKTSIAEIVPFVLFGEVSGSVKRYENGIAPHDDGLVHAAEVTFDDNTKFRREITWKNGGGNATTLYVNGAKVKRDEFNGRWRTLLNNGADWLFNLFKFCELNANNMRYQLLDIFGGKADHDLFTLDEFKDAESIFNGSPVDVFKADCREKLRVIKSEADYIPHRIDELTKQRANLPADLDAEKSRLNAKIAEIQSKIDSLSKTTTDALKSEYSAITREIEGIKSIKDRLERNLKSAQSERLQLLEQYRRVAGSKNGNCPICGQSMPLDLFIAKRDEQLQVITEKGLSTVDDIKSLTADVDKYNAEIESLTAQATRLNAQIQAQATDESTRTERVKQLRNESAELNYKLAEVCRAIEDQTRVDELTARGKELNKKIAVLEGHIQLAERFQEKKIELLEGHINAQFQYVKFKLFDYRIGTGEATPTCIPMLNGVPYNALSSGEKLKCALDILSTLQKHFGVQMPLIIDNAESYTLNSFVDLPNQKFLFKVSDDTELVIDIQEQERKSDEC